MDILLLDLLSSSSSSSTPHLPKTPLHHLHLSHLSLSHLLCLKRLVTLEAGTLNLGIHSQRLYHQTTGALVLYRSRSLYGFGRSLLFPCYPDVVRVLTLIGLVRLLVVLLHMFVSPPSHCLLEVFLVAMML